MRSAKASGGKGGAPPSFSTSAGRANLALALETTDREKTVVGFDRYNRRVAALVPVEAVSMLAGQGAEVDPAIRAKIVRMAKLFLSAKPAKPKSVRRTSPPRKAKTAKKKSAKSRSGTKSARRKTTLGNRT